MSDGEPRNSPSGGGDVKQDPIAPIEIKVTSAMGDEVMFKIKRNTKLSKLQAAYAKRIGKDAGSIRFLFEGKRLDDDDTPASLDMDDGDSIDAMVERMYFAWSVIVDANSTLTEVGGSS
ncbi:Ubiquitin-like protein pmt3/smt3 [Leucoagaricus sp. SymC.cos]|nr:Ubiquitin-like protein pmt3/smt3 [Leucoagaricus sp. SymC.cos]